MIDCSVQGHSHIKSGLVNQDYHWRLVRRDCAFCAAADGHGGRKYVRSREGAERAVLAFANAVLPLRDKSEKELSDPRLIASIRDSLGKDIHQNWLELVDDHRARTPLDAAERRALEGTVKADALREVVEEDGLTVKPVCYGTTLLGVVLTRSVYIFVQLGDGDFLQVDDSGAVSRVIPKSETQIANETESLCMPNAWSHFRVRIERPATFSPQLLMLSTDGYSNSFASDDAFFKTATDYLELIKKGGADRIGKSLREWLSQTSRDGSGDDITVAILYRKR